MFPKKGWFVGGGRKFTEDVPRRRGATSLLQEVADMGAAGAASGSMAATDQYCARTHEVRFKIAPDIHLAPGDPVELVPGNPPALTNGIGLVGKLSGAVASALNGCLVLDWRLSGTIRDVDPLQGEAVVVIAGER